MTCIRKEDIAKAKQALLQEHGVSLTKLHKVYNTTAQRVNFLTEQFGDREEAIFFNNKYERYLLNRQKENLRAWVKKSEKQGIDNTTKKSLLDKIDSLSSVLKTGTKNNFLQGLIEQKLGFSLTKEESQKILDLNSSFQASKKNLYKIYPNYDKMGLNRTGMNEWTKKLNEELTEFKENDKLGPILDYASKAYELKELYIASRLSAEYKKNTKAETETVEFLKKLKEKILSIGGGLKSVKASVDISFGRQLSSALLGYKGAWKGWLDGVKQFKDLLFSGNNSDKQVKIGEMILLARPNSVNGVYSKLGVAVGIKEEAFPESFVSKAERKLPLIRVFTASEYSFNLAVQLGRAEVADSLIELAEGDIGSLKTQGAGNYINSVTGRGNLPFNKPETERAVNNLLFSPRWLMSRIDRIKDFGYIFNIFDTSKGNIVSREKGLSALRTTTFMFALPMIIKYGMSDDDDDKKLEKLFEIRSSDFGKIVVGDTRFDMTFGIAALLTLTGRMATGQKVGVGGVKRDVTWKETLGSFFEGKSAPAVRSLMDAYKLATEEDPKDFMYQPITSLGLVKSTFIPITLESMTEIGMPTESQTAQGFGILADFIGIGANTYGIAEKDIGKSQNLRTAEKKLAWEIDRNPSDIKPTKNSNIYKKLSGDKRERAIEDFSKLYNDKATRLVNSSKFKNMTYEEQSKELGKIRSETSREINKRYNVK